LRAPLRGLRPQGQAALRLLRAARARRGRNRRRRRSQDRSRAAEAAGAAMDLGQRSLAPVAQEANRRGIAPLRALPTRALNDADEMNIRPAQGDEAQALSALALKAKAHWGYPLDTIELWKKDLTVSAHTIASTPSFVAVLGDEIVGFYSLS